jgi:hypothetical protein
VSSEIPIDLMTAEELSAAHQLCWERGRYADCTRIIMRLNKLRGHTPRAKSAWNDKRSDDEKDADEGDLYA